MADGSRHTDDLIHEMHSDVKVLCIKVDALERCVITGNGGKSLLQRVASLERWRSGLAGAWTATVGSVIFWLKYGSKL